jgi:hypothetical protein
MEKKILGVIFVAVFAWVSNGLTASEDVYLLPSRPGEVSEILPVHKAKMFSKDQASAAALPPIDQILMHDNDLFSFILVGLLAGDTLANWFQSPASCSLLAILIATTPEYQPSGINFDAFAADPADSIDFFSDYDEYHGGSAQPGPSPIETFLQVPTTLFSDTADPWDTLFVVSNPNVGTNAFIGGYIMPDSTPNTYFDANVPPPYYSFIWRPDPGSGIPGWYSSWHIFYIRAKVRMYDNPPPVLVALDRIPDTYLLTGRVVSATLTDFGVPLDSTGVESAELTYTVNGSAPSTLSMTLVAGDSSDGTWESTIPGQSVGDTVCYFVEGTDYQGAVTASATHCYVIRAGTPGQCVLFVNDGEFYPGSGSYDVIDTVLATFDYWDSDAWGTPDASVLNFGYTQIIWFTWSGFAFAEDSLLIANYLDNGGNLWISSIDLPGGGFGYGFGAYSTNPGAFLQDYLHILSGTDNFVNPDTSMDVFGVLSDPISDPFSGTPLTVWPYSFALGNNWSGEFTTDGSAVDNFFYQTGEVSGYHFEGTVGGASHRLVCQYWPVTYIEVPGFPDSADVVSQAELARRTIEWLGCPTVVGIEETEPPLTPKAFLLSQNSPNPLRTTSERTPHGRDQGGVSRYPLGSAKQYWI